METDLFAYALKGAARMSGVSRNRIAYWDRTGFFHPSMANDPGRPFGRMYTFRDLVALRTISKLRNEYKIPLQRLRAVRPYLERHHSTPWASLKLFVLTGKRIAFADPKTGVVTEADSEGQAIMEFAIEPVARGLRERIRKLSKRPISKIGEIERNRYVMSNAPVVSGTRVPTSAVYAYHLDGKSDRQIRALYPHLKIADIRAAVNFEEERAA